MSKTYNNFGYKWLCGGCPTKKGNGSCLCGDVCMAAQDVCLRKQNMMNNNERVMKYVHNKNHGWTLVPEDQLINLVANNNSFIMEILNSYPKKVYFDIDGKDPENITLSKCKDIISSYFPNCQMAISGYETNEKKSYHITLPEYILENHDDMMQLKKIVQHISKFQCKYFDWKVYTINRPMKCIYQSKPNGDVQQIIEDTNPKHHFIMSFFTGTEQKINVTIPEDVMQTELIIDNIQTAKQSTPIITLQLSEEFKKEDLLDAKKLLTMAPNGASFDHAYTWKVAMFCFSNGLTFDDFWEFAKIKDASESRKLKWQNIHWQTISNSEYRMSKNGFKKLLSFYYPQLIDVDTPQDLMTKQFVKTLNIESTQIQRINEEHFDTNSKCVTFNICMGGGKTTMTVDYLESTNQSFIWLAPRCALVMNTFQRFQQKNMGVVNYMNCGRGAAKTAQINSANKLILECESLNRIQDTTKYDVVVIDEIESVLLGWDSQTHIDNHIEENFNKFISLLQNCRKIILLDAFTTTTTLRLLRDLNIDVTVYGSDYKPAAKIIKETTDYEETINKIVTDLDAGKKLYVFHAFKSANKKHYSIEQLKSIILERCQIKKPTIIVYHGDASDTVKGTLYNVNDVWNNADCIITTSCITVGVNYEGLDFDKIYLMVSGCVNAARDVIQTSMRIRKTKEDVIEMYFFDKNQKSIYTYPEFYKSNKSQIYRNIIDNISVEKQTNFLEAFIKFCEITNYDVSNISESMKRRSSKFVNELYTSKMLVPYNSINKLTHSEADQIENENIFEMNATQMQKFEISRHYFDIKFRSLTVEDRASIWNDNLGKAFDGLDNQLIELVMKDNDTASLIDVNFNKIKIGKETQKYIDETFKTTIKNVNQRIVKLINMILGCDFIETHYPSAKSKSTSYITSQLGEKIIELKQQMVEASERNSSNSSNGLDAFIE